MEGNIKTVKKKATPPQFGYPEEVCKRLDNNQKTLWRGT